MRCVTLLIAGVALGLWLLAGPALAEEATGPDAFASLLLVQNQYGPGPDDGELLDLWLNYFNETNPDLLTEPACYAPLMWNWPEFTASTSYTAQDENGEWDVTCSMFGVMNLDKLATIAGADYPYIGTLSVSYTIDWRGADGSSFSTAWSYALVDIPPVAEPASDVFLAGLPDGLPGDRLTYGVHLDSKDAVDEHLNELHYGYSTENPEFPESNYSTAIDNAVVQALDFDMIMYYFGDEGE